MTGGLDRQGSLRGVVDDLHVDAVGTVAEQGSSRRGTSVGD